MALGASVRAARKGHGLSQTELAKLAGVSKRTIVALEGDENVTRDVIESVTQALGLSSFAFAGGGEPDAPTPTDIRGAALTAYAALWELGSTFRLGASIADRASQELRSALRAEKENASEAPKKKPTANVGVDVFARGHAVADLPFEPVEGDSVTEFPVRGYVAAGAPIDYETRDETVKLPSMFVGENEQILRARGDSMIEWSIEDGDFLIVERRAIAATGELVIAWYNDGVTVKQWFYKRGKRMLVAGNPDAESYEIKEGDVVEILGVVTNIVKSTKRIVGTKRVPIDRAPRARVRKRSEESK